jgi:hypothetical protein
LDNPDHVPELRDDAAWTALAGEHAENCQWVASRAWRLPLPQGYNQFEDDLKTALEYVGLAQTRLMCAGALSHTLKSALRGAADEIRYKLTTLEACCK